GKNHNGVLQQPLFRKRFHKFSDAPVRLHDHITPRAHSRCADKALVGRTRHMWLVKRIIEEERLVLMLPDIRLCPREERVGHIFVYPFSLFTAFHEADAGNAVYDAVIMAVMPPHLEELRVLKPRGLP